MFYLRRYVLVACQPQEVAESPVPTATPVLTQTPVTSNKPVAYPDRELSANPAQLPKLPYAANALEKAIDAQTMTLHHDKHHQTYVDNLNKALEQQPNLRASSVEAMLRDLNSVPESIRTTVRNNGAAMFAWIQNRPNPPQQGASLTEQTN